MKDTTLHTTGIFRSANITNLPTENLPILRTDLVGPLTCVFDHHITTEFYTCCAHRSTFPPNKLMLLLVPLIFQTVHNAIESRIAVMLVAVSGYEQYITEKCCFILCNIPGTHVMQYPRHSTRCTLDACPVLPCPKPLTYGSSQAVLQCVVTILIKLLSSS